MERKGGGVERAGGLIARIYVGVVVFSGKETIISYDTSIPDAV